MTLNLFLPEETYVSIIIGMLSLSLFSSSLSSPHPPSLVLHKDSKVTDSIQVIRGNEGDSSSPSSVDTGYPQDTFCPRLYGTFRACPLLFLCHFGALPSLPGLGDCLGSDIPEGLVPCPPEVLLSDPQWPSPATQLTEKSEPLLDLGDFPFSLFNHTAFCLFPPEEELLASCHQGVQAVQKHEAGRRYLLVRKSEMGRASLLAGRRRR